MLLHSKKKPLIRIVSLSMQATPPPPFIMRLITARESPRPAQHQNRISVTISNNVHKASHAAAAAAAASLSFRKAIAALNSFSPFQSSTPCVAYNQDAQFPHSLRCSSLRSVCGGKLARNARKYPAVACQRRVPSLQRKVQFGYRSALICSFCIILHVADVVMRIQNAHAMRKMAKCASR